MIVMLTKVTAKMFKRFTSWLKNRRHFIFSWYTKDSQETQEPERSLAELPKEVREKLIDEVENLPINPADTEAILSILDEAFALWHEDPSNANNSVVILSSPVTPVSRILSETLPEWAKQKQVSIKLLPFTSRPEAIASTKSKLEHYIKRKSTPNYSETQKLEVVVIPNLSWCFLRSLDGLEGIDYLRSLLGDGCEITGRSALAGNPPITPTKNRFWIIGSNQVCWEYLNLVYNLEAYCGRADCLPAISAEKLQEWLTPIIDKLEITFDEPRIDKQLLEGDKDNRDHYFDILGDISQGVSIVAVQGFLKSIHCEEVDHEDESEITGRSAFRGNTSPNRRLPYETTPTQPKSEILVAQTPRLGKLPSLESADHYLLYSLLLHEDLTLSALAESLGDDESEVQARVQVLRQQGVIEQQDRVLKVNPIYYPQLKRELEVNNFIINRQ